MRLAGMILLVTAGSAMGFYKANGLKQRIREIIALQNAFRLLETEIYYTRSPIPQALDIVAHREPEWMRCFFHQVCYGMEQQCLPLNQAWEASLDCLRTSTFLCDDELDAVRSFGQSLGAGDVTEQVKHFQILQQRLQYALEQAEYSYAQKARIWQYMGICISMAMVLLLY